MVIGKIVMSVIAFGLSVAIGFVVAWKIDQMIQAVRNRRRCKG